MRDSPAATLVIAAASSYRAPPRTAQKEARLKVFPTLRAHIAKSWLRYFCLVMSLYACFFRGRCPEAGTYVTVLIIQLDFRLIPFATSVPLFDFLTDELCYYSIPRMIVYDRWSRLVKRLCSSLIKDTPCDITDVKNVANSSEISAILPFGMIIQREFT
jgi:hypothetical protein